MLMFIPTYGILLLIRFFAVITKYTVLDEQRREAKEGKSQRKNPRSITRGASVDIDLRVSVHIKDFPCLSDIADIYVFLDCPGQ